MRHTLVLLLATLAAFGGSLAGSFHFDDYAIFSDPVLTAPSGWWEVWKPLDTRPLTHFTFWLNYRLGGRNPIGYHAVSLGLHLLAVFLACDALSRVLPARAALVAAALFALHPIQTEAVAYIHARGTLLAAVFFLLSLRSWARGSHSHAVAWVGAALLAKEEAVAIPLVFLLLHFSISRNRREMTPLAAMFAIALAAGLRGLFVTVVESGTGAGASAGISPAAYFATQGVVLLRYARLLIAPWGLSVDPDIAVTTGWQSWLAWVVIAAGAALALRRFGRAREGFWMLAALAMLAPSSSIFPLADLAADRRLYLPLVAIGAAAGLAVERVNRKVLIACAGVLVLLSFAHTRVWQTEESLWRDAVAKAPEKLRPRIQLARSLPPKDALAVLETARRLAPRDAGVAAELGRVNLAIGDPARALAEFGRALALDPGNAQALNNRGAALLALGQTDAAREDFLRALSADQCLFEARRNLLRLGVDPPPAAGCRYTPDQLAELMEK